MKQVKLIFVLLLIIFTICLFFKNNILFAFKGDYKFISESDKDDVYYNFLFVKSKENSTEFSNLIKKILYKDSGSLPSKTMVINYIKTNKEKQFLKQLIELKVYTNNITDTSHYGNPKTRNSSFFIALDTTIEALSSVKN